MVVATLIEVQTSLYIIPIFAIPLFIYTYKSTHTIRVAFLVFLIATLITEILFLYNYEGFISSISLFSIAGYLSLLFVMRPILKKRIKGFSNHNIVELLVGFISVGFITVYLSYLVMPFIPETALFLLTLFTFGITLSVCFVIPNYNLHPDNVALSIIGAAYLAGTSFAFVYHFIFQSTLILLISISLTVFMKIALATYITKFDRINNEGAFEEYSQ